MEHRISIQDALGYSTQLQTDTARLDVECLLTHVLACESTYLRTWPDKCLTPDQVSTFQSLLARRIQGEPIAHICGTRAFWTLDLLVSPQTLIPRPDTEILVEKILDLSLPKDARILDLGTGTGAIALALASERNQWQVYASDFQVEIVELAQRNANKHNIKNVTVFQSDWFKSLPPERFDLIVSNPPYIDPEDKHLVEGDVRFEPLSALIADNNGLADIEHIVNHARPYLKAEGWLVLEHGYDQAQTVRALFRDAGYRNIESIQDYGRKDRMTLGQYS